MKRWWPWSRGGRNALKARDSNRAAIRREFVYLDEVSVTSLMASRGGALITDLTTTATETRTAEVGGKVGAKAILDAELNSRLGSSSGQQTQIVRKSIIQATFKDLYSSEEERLLLRHGSPPDFDTTDIYSEDAVVERLKEPRFRQWATDSAHLKRGDLIEMDASLTPAEIYSLSSAIDGILEMFKASPSSVPAGSATAFAQAGEANSVIKKLLVGLVPLECPVVEYRVANLQGRQFILHREIVDAIGGLLGEPARELHLAGVGEAALFWKDLRRLLFAGSSYTIYARVGSGGLRESWHPLKALQSFETVAPGAGAELQQHLLELPRLQQGAFENLADERYRNAMRQALVEFADSLTSLYGATFSLSRLTSAGLPSSDQCKHFEASEERRHAFGDIARWVATSYGLPVNAQDVARLRNEAVARVLEPVLTSFPRGQSRTGPAKAKLLIDAEIVAIYW